MNMESLKDFIDAPGEVRNTISLSNVQRADVHLVCTRKAF